MTDPEQKGGALLMCDADGPPASIVYTTVPSLHGRAIHPEFCPGRPRKSTSERTHNPECFDPPPPTGRLFTSSLALIRNACTATMRQKEEVHEQSDVDHDLVWVQSLACCCSLSLFISSILQLPELEQCAAGRSIRRSLTRRRRAPPRAATSYGCSAFNSICFFAAHA
ncbi:hypothetical protein BDP81DRAFT_181207 [Colletotrichum phormii]|uniref:Uncharacterized protein n=1 Tax=Colletotrichum phormii TaxID=359342 RepID=A0AAJ0A004_9PEZI|nr:uncharacterized protein BDP81DRAFT_181207 [Colletotrichum phormii]KAK1639662.1 hypothetical protein BDP81DRAFT_181207 [Colletotrichum phormii]